MNESTVQYFKIITNKKADEHLVEHVKQSMEVKLSKKRNEGYGGWHHLELCSNEYLLKKLKKHIDKGDMIDVINFAGMISCRTSIYGDEA